MVANGVNEVGPYRGCYDFFRTSRSSKEYRHRQDSENARLPEHDLKMGASEEIEVKGM